LLNIFDSLAFDHLLSIYKIPRRQSQ